MRRRFWAGLATILAALGARASVAEATITATLEAQEVGSTGSDREGIFRLSVIGLDPGPVAPLLQSAGTPIFQVVALPGGQVPGAEEAPQPTGRWTYLGRYHGSVPKRFVLLAAAGTLPAEALRELATLEPQLLPPAEDAPRLREEWMRVRLERIRAEILGPQEVTGFWRYQEAYLQNRLEGSAWASSDIAPWTPTRPTGILGSLEMVTGMSAVEESLQLSVLRGASAPADARPEMTVPISDLQPPSIQSHDFAELQKGLPPGPVPAVARLAPEDSLFVTFSSLPRALELSDQVHLWQGALSRLSEFLYTDGNAQSFVTSLGLQLNPQLRPFYGTYQAALQPGGAGILPAPCSARAGSPSHRSGACKAGCLDSDKCPFYGLAVGSMALVIDDPYLAEGADLSLILEARSAPVLDLRLAQFDAAVLAAHPGLEPREEQHGQHRLRILHSADGSVRSYRAAVAEWRVYSTSLKALQRVLDAWDGRRARLSDAKDFAYVRSVLPGGDGFLYISDACVRRFVSPAFKVAELRRVRCLGNLRVLDYAADLSDMEKNPQRSAGSLAESGYVARAPLCPQDGAYAYDVQAGRFRCSLHGTSADLAHLSELPVERLTAEEAEGYKTFVENYNLYWPRYFDPIGLEIGVQGGKIRFSTCILPLIESSTYNEFKSLAGGPPRDLRWGGKALEQIGGIFSVKLTAFDGYRHDLSHIESPALREGVLSTRNWLENALPWETTKDIFSWIGPEGSLILLDSSADSLTSLNNSVGAVRVAVVDADLAQHLLQRLARFAPFWLGTPQTEGLPPGVRLRLPGNGRDMDELDILLSEDSLFVIWGKPEVRSGFSEKLLALKPIPDEPGSQTAANAYLGLNLRLLPQAVLRTLQSAEIFHAEHCLRNLAKLEDLCSFEAFEAGSVAEVLRRTRSVPGLACPDGGVYERHRNGTSCSVHGSRLAPRKLDTPPQAAPLRQLIDALDRLGATLSFTPEGIRTSLELPMAPLR